MSTRISTETKLPTISQRGLGHGPGRFEPGEKLRDSRGTILRILTLYTRHGKIVAVAIILTLLSTLIGVLIPLYIGSSFNTFNTETKLVETDVLMGILAAILLFHLTNWLINTACSWIMLEVSQKLILVLRSQFFSKLQKLPLMFFDNHSHGDTMSRITNDADNISSTITTATTQLLSSVLTVGASIAIMASLNLTLTLTVMVAVPLITLLTQVIAKKSRKYFLAQQQALGSLNGIIEENIVGLKIVKAFGKQQQVTEEFKKVNEELFNKSVNAQIWAGYMMPFTNVINNLVFALVALVGGYLAINEAITVGAVISFLTYSKQFAHPLNNVAGMFNIVQQALASAERIFEILDQEQETPDKADALSLTSPTGNIRFDDVSFSYQPGIPVLKNISFQVQAGETIAIVGETGSGKTTIINLLNRFYDPDSGSIFIDGLDIKDIKRTDLRNCFSVVLQETSLFSGTIMENIRYARPEATDRQIIKAAKISRADDFITRLPQGYQTQVSGVNDTLSEGQKQLLAIARAVLCQSPILILDEATSFVDTKTEKDIQKAFLSLLKNSTSFLIAHRLSTIKDADRIMVIKDGRIHETGNHTQLMNKKGYYYDMLAAQMGQQKRLPN